MGKKSGQFVFNVTLTACSKKKKKEVACQGTMGDKEIETEERKPRMISFTL